MTTPNTCIRCGAGVPSHRVNSLCEECYAEEWQSDFDWEADADSTCEECGGSGEVQDDDVTTRECPNCGGTGVA
jgi:DnaJ-class molecular chaperone